MIKWPGLDPFPQILSLSLQNQVASPGGTYDHISEEVVGFYMTKAESTHPPKLLLVIPGVQACQECQEGQDVYCGRCVQRMFAFPAGPAAPSRDTGEEGHSGQKVGATIKRRQAYISKLCASDTTDL